MGITIHYRGTVADLNRVEDMEDRLVDLALDFGGQARIWRSHSREQPDRVVRGVILSLSPGHESLSLLVSPEGWLVGLHEIEDAEEGRLTEQPWCFCKTQFGPVEAHVAVVEVLTALKAEFLPDLEVLDEGDYWETRDLPRLKREVRVSGLGNSRDEGRVARIWHERRGGGGPGHPREAGRTDCRAGSRPAQTAV